jgi:hypothetical protein
VQAELVAVLARELVPAQAPGQAVVVEAEPRADLAVALAWGLEVARELVPAQALGQAVVAEAEPRAGLAVALAWGLEAPVRAVLVRVAEAAPALAAQVAAVQEVAVQEVAVQGDPVAEARAEPVGLVVAE